LLVDAIDVLLVGVDPVVIFGKDVKMIVLAA
jgi:hypothetical protein